MLCEMQEGCVVRAAVLKLGDLGYVHFVKSGFSTRLHCRRKLPTTVNPVADPMLIYKKRQIQVDF